MACRPYGKWHISLRRHDIKLIIQIYSFIFTSYPFQYLGDDDVLVAQMIGFVEELPEDWHPQWVRMRLNSNREVILEESERTTAITR